MILLEAVLTFATCSTLWLPTAEGSNSPWATWWAYSGLAGPQHWGLLNPDWSLCRTGKFQSPIDVEPQRLLYDPRLRRTNIRIPDKVQATLKNTGNDLTLTIDDSLMNWANFSDGPFLYSYRLAEVKIHIGKVNNRGSEHLIDGKAFGAELQFICYNSDLFSSMAAAQHVPYGVAIVAVLAEATRSEKEANSAFTILTNVAKRIPWQGNAVRVPNFNLAALVPETNYYVTYEGSFTQPACLETVTWLILNRPILIQASQLDTLRQLQKEQADTRMKMSNGNSRPVSPLYNRAVRTNINFPTTGGLCNMKRIFYYEVNDVVR